MAEGSKIKDKGIGSMPKTTKKRKTSVDIIEERKHEAELLAKKRRIKNDCIAVILMAIGVFLAIGLFPTTSMGALGSVLSLVMHGLMGLGGYALPFLVILTGVYMIIAYRKRLGLKQIIICASIVFILLTLIHSLFDTSVQNTELFVYYGRAFDSGAGSHMGGGLLGAILAYPLLLLVGSIGTILFLIAAIIALLIVLTGKTISSSFESALDKRTERINSGKYKYEEELFIEEQDLRMQASKKLKEKKKSKLSVPISSKMQVVEKVTKPAQDTDNGIVKPIAIIDDEIKPFSDLEPGFEPLTEPVAELEEIIRPIETAYTSKLPSDEIEKRDKDTSNEDALADNKIDLPLQPVLEYQRPPITLLKLPEPTYAPMGDSPEAKGKLLISTLESFGIGAKIVNISVGPAITRFEIQPAQGIRVNRITSLSNDIALALAAPRVRIEAPIPGKAAVGIEIPNSSIATVLLREIIESREFKAHKSPIAFALGKDIAGAPLIGDLDKMPHMLIAGTTGSGKSVCVNDIIVSMIYKSSPDDLRLILIDPKVVELSVFSTLPHLLMPVVTDPKRASMALKWAAHEMDNRYELMAKVGARERGRYNSMMENPEDKLPKIVVIIDELADLMMVAQKDVEESICRIAQLGRAAGIHLIVATQSPRVDIITGLIKANIPSRIAFMVSNGTDSRVILDMVGAEKLLGKGDMLFHPNGANKPVRAQGAFVSDEEVESISEFFAGSSDPKQRNDVAIDAFAMKSEGGEMRGNGKEDDDLLPRALWVCIETGVASTSLLQRKLRVGYARASRLIDIMEEKHFISGFEGSKPRKLLINAEQYREIYGSTNGTEPTAENME